MELGELLLLTTARRTQLQLSLQTHFRTFIRNRRWAVAVLCHEQAWAIALLSPNLISPNKQDPEKLLRSYGSCDFLQIRSLLSWSRCLHLQLVHAIQLLCSDHVAAFSFLMFLCLSPDARACQGLAIASRDWPVPLHPSSSQDLTAAAALAMGLGLS